MRRGCPPKMESRGDGCSNVSRGRLIRERRGLRCRGPGPGPEQQRPGAKRRGRPGPAQGPACVEINRCFGCTDNSSRSHFSAMAWPRWLRRAVRNRHGHAIEQASRRWRGGRKILLSARLRTAAPPSLSGGAQATSTLSPPTISSSASVGADGTRSSARAAANNTSSPRRGCIFWCLLFGYVSFAFWAL